MYSTVALHCRSLAFGVYLYALLWDGGAYLRLSSSSSGAVGETRSDSTRHSPPQHPPPGKHPAEQIDTHPPAVQPGVNIAAQHCSPKRLQLDFYHFCCNKSPPLMKWLIKLRGFTNCVTSALRYLHVRPDCAFDSIYDLNYLVFCSSALLAKSACHFILLVNITSLFKPIVQTWIWTSLF